jgi:hypothetical protein
MPSPVRNDIHIDGPLSDIAIAYKQDSFIADQVFPIVPVDKQSDKYFTWTKGFWMRNSVQERAPGDTYPEGRLGLSNDTYYCNLYHLGYGIPDEDAQNQDAAVELEITGAEWLAQQFMLNREIKLAGDIFVINVWANDVVGGTNFVKWSDYDNSNPVTDVNTGKETIQQSTGKRANTLVIGEEVKNTLAEHPNLLDKFKYTQTGILDAEQIRQALKVDTLLVGEAVQESSMEGASSATRAYIWGQNALLLHVPDSPGLRVAAAGYTFTWRINGAGGRTVAISNVRQDDRDRDFLKGKHAFDNKVTGTDLGYYFSDCMD